MATVKYYPIMPFLDGHPHGEPELLEHDDTFAVIKTGWVNGTMTYYGHDLTYEEGKLVGGIVTEIVDSLDGENRFSRMTNINLDMSIPGPRDLMSGDDIVIGSRLANILNGGAGDDDLRGGKGGDSIFGEVGNDLLTGGLGRDRFYFEVGNGKDRIVDFQTRGPNRDTIEFETDDVSDFSQLRMEQVGHRVIITYGEDDMIILRHTELDDLMPRNFDFE